MLAGRFGRRVTLVTAGAGFGKTTSIAQAFHENELAPIGVDVWLACDSSDNDAGHLSTDLVEALRTAMSPDATGPAPTPAVVGHAVEACRSLAPVDVCLTFDDVHVFEQDSTGAQLLQTFIDEMPANAHVVLVGRSEPPIALARLIATNQAAQVTEADLALAPSEVAQILERLDVEVTPELIERLAGWPALVRLAGESQRGSDFVWQEVVDWLPDEQRLLLRALVAVGEGDAELLSAVTGVADAAQIGRVPLVHGRGAGDHQRWGAHDLWIELLHEQPDVHTLRASAAAWLTEHGRFDEAVDLTLVSESADVPAVIEALRGALAGLHTPAASAMRRWLATAPDEVRAHPVGHLLRGLVLRLDNPGGDDCRDELQLATDGFIALDDQPSAVAALGALAFAHHVRRDGPALVEVFQQLAEFAADGTAEAVPYRVLAQASLATATSQPEQVLEHTRELLAQDLPSDVRAVALWHEVNALNNLGFNSVDAAREMIEIGLPLPGLGMGWYSARWRAGEIASLLADDSLQSTGAAAGARDDFLTAVWRTVIAAGTGDVELATRSLDEVLRSDAHESQWQTAGSVLIPRIAVAYERGECELAVELMREMVEHHPVDAAAHGYYANALCLAYELLPELRSYFDELTDHGPLYQRDLRLNQAHAAAVDGDAGALHSLVLPSTPQLLPALGLSRSMELLSALWLVGMDGIAEAVTDLHDLLGEVVRVRLRAATSHPTELIAKGAREIVERIPVPPSSYAAISLFGGTELAIDGEPVDHADWRRERVRALLTYLATHPDTTREAAISALWPDATPEAGRRNLRSTLNVLNGVLEPDRVGGDAPFFVRSIGQRLRLELDEHLTVDVIDFERFLDEADEHERSGAPSLAIAPLRRALALYRGDLLPDSYDDWVLFTRDRLRARYVRAAVRCAELLVADGQPASAIDVIAPALAVEPWSEPAHRALVSAHLGAGDVASARRAMATCHEALADIGGPAEELTTMLERRLTRSG